MSSLAGVASRGNQLKILDEDTNEWYKADYLGYEGLSEFIASELLAESNLEHVNYEMCKFHVGGREVTGCRSKNFLQVGDAIVSVYQIMKKHYGIDLTRKLLEYNLKDKIQYTVENLSRATECDDFGKYLTKILQLDALILNDDRHFRNISFLYNENSGYRICPVYDNGGAFLSDEFTYDFKTDSIMLMREVVSLPFSQQFDEQMDVCEMLYGGNLELKRENLEYDAWKKKALEFYSPQQYGRVETVLRQTVRKYRYLFG